MSHNIKDIEISFLICNHYSSDLLEIQFELFRKLNPRRNYKIVIVDDSNDADEQKILKEFRDKGEIDKLVFVKTDITDGSERHTFSLKQGFRKIDTRLICFMDVDYFWLKNNFVSFLISKLSSGGCRVFGAQRAWGEPKTIYEWSRLLLSFWIKNLALRLLKLDLTMDRQLSPAPFCLCMETEVITKNNLSISYPGILLFRVTHRDTLDRIRQFIEQTFSRDQIVCLKPTDYEPLRRGSRVGHLYRMNGENMGLHLNHATISKSPDTTLTDEEILATQLFRKQLRLTILSLIK